MNIRKTIVIIFIFIYLMQLIINIKPVQAQIFDGDEVELLRRS